MEQLRVHEAMHAAAASSSGGAEPSLSASTAAAAEAKLRELAETQACGGGALKRARAASLPSFRRSDAAPRCCVSSHRRGWSTRRRTWRPGWRG